jgi:hypothetical protein
MAEQQLPPSTTASVVLDIGGEVGALVVELPRELLGRELDLFPLGGADLPVVHTEVRERRVGDGVVYAAVYPTVPAGSYLVEGLDQVFVVQGGRVTESRAAGMEPMG